MCEFYKSGHCKYGPKGQNKEGKCYNRHPDPCEKFSAGTCNDKKCKLMHPAPVCTFFKKQACGRKFCKFSHPKQTLKDPRKPNGGNQSSDAKIAAIDSKMDTFLGELSKFTKELNQMKSKMEANNNRGFQNAAFPSIWTQPNPQLQTMQQRF